MDPRPRPADPPSPPPRPFAWPPRPLSPQEQAALEAASRRAAAQDLAARRFAGRPRIARMLADWIDQIERNWLGITAPPFATRARDEAWAPDDLSAFCPRCGGSVGPHEVAAVGPRGCAACPACARSRLPWERFVRLGPYEGLLRDAVLDAKFTRWRRLALDLGRELGAQLNLAAAESGLDIRTFTLVPIPMHPWRRLLRGMDHAMVIARGVQDVTGAAISPVLRRRRRPSQLEVPPSRRQENVRHSMWARRPVGSGRVVLIDDVRTTGATLREASRAVLEGNAGSGAVLWAGVVAVTPEAGDGRSEREGGVGGESERRGEAVEQYPNA